MTEVAEGARVTRPAATSLPTVGREYEDTEGRVLRVHGVRPGDRLGREVVGTLRERVGLRTDAREGATIYGESCDYSCTMATWADVWRDKAPRCHGDGHEGIVFKPLTYPVHHGAVQGIETGIVYTHWAPCPTNGEPILLRSVPREEARGDGEA